VIRLLPVPTTKPYIETWLPELEKFKPLILEGRESAELWEEILQDVRDGKIQLFFLADYRDDSSQPVMIAVLGLSYLREGGQLVAEGCWVVGEGVNAWFYLYPEFEEYLIKHVGVKKFGTKCRPGWARLMRGHGYKQTHVYIERRF
jgi:hypothetical protein